MGAKNRPKLYSLTEVHSHLQRNINVPTNKLKWRRLEGKKRTLECSLIYENSPQIFTPTGLRDEHLDPVLIWCRDNNCGYRTSFNHFAFDTDEQMAWFILRWS